MFPKVELVARRPDKVLHRCTYRDVHTGQSVARFLRNARHDLAEGLKPSRGDFVMAVEEYIADRASSRPHMHSEAMRTARVVLGRLRRRPSLTARHLLAFANESLLALRRRSELKPLLGDRRFADPGWNEGRINRLLMQTYLAAAKEVYALIKDLDLHGRDAASARFLSTMLVEALSPSNNPLANPAVREAARRSRGRTLLRGLQHLIGDQLDNDGLISMVDRNAFELGRNVAATPGAVVFRNDLLELIQYKPTTAEVYTRPLMIVPAQINRYYVMDLSPGNSLARYLVGQGFQVFMISWRNPAPELRDCGMERYCDAVEEAHKAVMEIAGSKDINWKGLCAGGITSSIVLGRYAARGNLGSVNSLTLNVTLLDLGQLEKTDIGFFFSHESLIRDSRQALKDGVLHGAKLAKMFAWVRPNDLIWNYWVNNYLMGQMPPAFDVLFWNTDTTRMTAGLHADFIDLLIANPFGRHRTWKVGATEIDLKHVELDKFVIGGRTDHITPWDGCYQAVNILGGKSEFVLVNSGHIQTVVSAPGKGKATYHTGYSTPTNAQEWLAAAKQTTGSWWEYWTPWLAARSGERKPAPTSLGNVGYEPLGAAPGTYIFEK